MSAGLPRRGLGKGRAARTALLALWVTAALAGCGRQSGPSQQAAPSPGPGSPAAGEASAPAGKEDVSAGAAGGWTVIVAPSAPSRIAPPAVSVKSPPGKGAGIREVRWLVNGVAAGAGEKLAPALFQRGDRILAVVTLRVDGADRVIETPEVAAVNALPAVTDVRIEPRAPVTGETVRAVVRANDPDGDNLTYGYKWFVDGLPVAGGGDSLVLKGVKKGSWVHVEVTPNDGFAGGAWKYSPRYLVVNALPVVKSQPPAVVPPSRVLTYSIAAEDPDGDPLTYTLVKGPEGMTLSGSTITWNVPDEAVGKTVEATVRIEDPDGGAALLNLSLAIRKP